MFPSVIPSHLRNDKGRGAEIKVYELLEQQLSDDFKVYWSRPWHRKTAEGAEYDGEVDFIVSHPQRGVLCIEVKGGRVGRDEQDHWISRDASGFAWKIKNPVMQARTGKHALIEKLKSSPMWKSRFFNARHAVILPDSSRPARELGAEAPLELFAFGDDLSRLQDWVISRLDDGNDAPAFGQDGMKALDVLLAAPFELRPHLARRISDDEKAIETLTREQAYILEQLDDNPQMAIPGAAGTGKTVLALEKAMRCAEAGDRTLFVCFNSALAEHLRAKVDGIEGLIVASFHELCGRLAREAGVALAETTGQDLYKVVLPNALIEAISQRPDLAFDAVIIDEGQDFQDTWLDALKLCLKDPDDGCYYVFYDDNQRIYNTDQSFLSALPGARFRLSRNLRNTRKIHQILKPWYDKPVRAAGPEGVEVEWIECRQRKQAYAKAMAIAADLVRNNQLRAEQIAILTASTRENCPVFTGKVAGAAVRAAGVAGAGVIGDTMRRFKGLEAKCVILIDIDQLHDRELIYVALSRASLLLYVIGDGADLARLRPALSSTPRVS